jgi:hypothetical protein
MSGACSGAAASPGYEGVFGMKRFRLLGLALLAVFALGALIATSASAALPELLPVVKGTIWTGKSVGEPVLETLSELTIKCKAATMDGEQLTDTLGHYHIHFAECQAATGKCNNVGDLPGVILALGEYHFVDDSLGIPLGVAILFLVEVHFSCGPLVLILVKGHVLCLILNPLETNVIHEFHCIRTVTEKGMPLDKHWWNDAGVEQTAVLLANLNEGTFEESTEIALGTVTFLEHVAFENH